jgi:hypothetical protein
MKRLTVKILWCSLLILACKPREDSKLHDVQPISFSCEALIQCAGSPKLFALRSLPEFVGESAEECRAYLQSRLKLMNETEKDTPCADKAAELKGDISVTQVYGNQIDTIIDDYSIKRIFNSGMESDLNKVTLRGSAAEKFKSALKSVLPISLPVNQEVHSDAKVELKCFTDTCEILTPRQVSPGFDATYENFFLGRNIGADGNLGPPVYGVIWETLFTRGSAEPDKVCGAFEKKYGKSLAGWDVNFAKLPLFLEFNCLKKEGRYALFLRYALPDKSFYIKATMKMGSN